MKKSVRWIALLIAIVMVCGILPELCLPTEAAKAYDLWIAGTRVTGKNRNDILGNGIFRYEPEINELIVRGEYESDGAPAIKNGIKGLTISLGGNLSVKNDGDSCILICADTTIRTLSGNVFFLNAYDKSCITVEGYTTLTLEDCNLMLSGAYGVTAINEPGIDKGAKLVLRRSNVHVTVSGYGIAGFDNGVELEECKVTEPEKYEIKNGWFFDPDSGKELGDILIRSTAPVYRIYVDGILINDGNKNDVLRDGGSVKYDPATMTLSLQDPVFQDRSNIVIDSYVNGLTIRGKAVIEKTLTNNGIWELSETTVNGDFTLVNTYGPAIEGYEGLKFAGGKVNLTGGYAAVYGDYFDNEGKNKNYLSFSGGTVTLKADEFAIYYEGPVSLSGGMKVVVPKKGKIVNQKSDQYNYWAVANAKGSVASEAKIAVTNPFEDVKDGTDYYNAVLWAAYHKPYQVTAGLDKTHFGPDKTVTRAQAMTFFWAALDRPKFKKANTRFVDVKKTDWFYKSVMWAVENGVTAGTDATHFSPNKTCNRGEILAFLYASLKKPKVKIKNPYKDVSNQWYKKAALWAYANGIERGEKGKFNASTPCTRASTVTYLYRFLEKQDLDLD